VLTLWVSADGTVQRAHAELSRNDPALAAAIEQSVIGASVGQPPPDGYPNPRRMRIGAQSPG
jgi:hypothetical protein